MNILLVLPYLGAGERYGENIKKLGPMLFSPLGIAYIGAVLEKEGHNVKIMDCSVEEITIPQLKEHLKKNKYDLIGFTVLTPQFGNFVETIKKIKPVLGKTPVMIGGPHPSIFPSDVLKQIPEVSYVVHGEGELTVVELVRALEKKGASKNEVHLSSIMGIAYRDGKKIIVTPRRPFIADLDTIPLPARHLMPMKKYIPAPSTYRRLPAVNMITTRGCPYNCIYCSSISVFGRKYRQHSVKRVLDEIEHVVKIYGAKEIYFLDDLFTLNKKWVTEICNELIKKKLDMEWSCNTRVNLVDLELLKKMKKAGCWQIHYGVESGSERLLKILKKEITLKQAEDAMRWTRKAGIQSRAYFMLGLPTETKEESRMTIDFAKKINPDYAKFSLTTPYPGTELFEMVKDTGEFKQVSWDKYKTMGGFVGTERPFVTKGRTSEELNLLQKRAHKEFYFRPKMILNHLLSIKSFSELRIDLRSFLALLKS